jgi:hypothetical protein
VGGLKRLSGEAGRFLSDAWLKDHFFDA